MNYPAHNSFAQHTGYKSLVARCIQAAFILALVCALKSTAPAATKDELRFRGGLRNSIERPISASQLQTLLESLRRRTGLAEMRFDENGLLTTGDHTHIEGGSAVARELVLAATNGKETFDLERYDGSPDIAFARLVPTDWVGDDKRPPHRIWLIQIDFRDFAELAGGAEVLAAFDPGIAVIHELVHGVFGFKDAVGSKTQLGECDEYVNRIRRELRLPERRHYSPYVSATALNQMLLARITFIRTSDRRRFYLVWVVARVSADSVPSLYGNRAVVASVR